MEKAKSLYSKLASFEWAELSNRDRVIMEILAWITLEVNDDDDPELDFQDQEERP